MQYTIKDHKGAALVIVEEEVLDHRNVDEFTAILRNQLDKGCKITVLDLSAVARMNEHGLCMLVKALKYAREKNGDVQLCALSDGVAQYLYIAGLLDVFKVHEDQATAIRSFCEEIQTTAQGRS